MSKHLEENYGKKLIYAIENNMIVKDYLPNHGNTFHGGYEELYLNKFRTYLGSASRAIINRGLNKENYNGT